MGERIAAVETWQSEHERACSTRWGVLIKMLGWGGSLAFITVLSVASWGITKLYDGQQQQNQMLQQLLSHRSPP